MIEDKISLVLKDINKLRDKLKDIKKDMKAQEKIDDPEYIELEKAYKDLRGQIKELKNSHEEELKTDDFYNELRELKLKAEEDLALAAEKLFKLISELPRKHFKLSCETEEGPVNLEVHPDMRVFLNGREEKKGV